MSIIQSTSERRPSDYLRCIRCHTALPVHAVFCRTCGERVDKYSKNHLSTNQAITNEYRITALIRRRPFVQLFLALDTERRLPVVIRDIDISSLDEEVQAEAIRTLQDEHALLYGLSLPDLMPIIEQRHCDGHLYTITAWPFETGIRGSGQSDQAPPSYILHDLLQSGIGLPSEETALQWGYQLCTALTPLHEQHIIFGDLDPHAIIISDDHYDGQIALMVSWLPAQIREHFSPTQVNAYPTPFNAPEVQQGIIEPRSDVYSLGVILYLLLTGTSPELPNKRRRARPLRSPRHLNPRISLGAEDIVMQALAPRPDDRFKSTQAMARDLFELLSGAQLIMPLPALPPGPPEHSSNGVVAQELMNGDISHIPASELQEHSSNGVVAQELMNGDISQAPAPEPSEMQPEASVAPAASEVVDDDRTIIISREQARAAFQQLLGHEPPTPTRKPTESAKSEKAAPVNGASPVEPADRPAHIEKPAGDEDEATIVIDPKDMAAAIAERQRRLRERTIAQAPTVALSVALPEEEDQAQEEAELPGLTGYDAETHDDAGTTEHENGHYADTPTATNLSGEPPPTPRQLLRDRLSGKLSDVTQLPQILKAITQRDRLNELGTAINSISTAIRDEKSFLKRMQRFFLGEQQLAITAAALIETPLRVHPNQGYALRVRLMGRDMPVPPPGASPNDPLAGLSALAHDDIVHIEVRSALFQNYAYMVQRADVQLPGSGFEAEVTIPIETLDNNTSGRRERLHIFFMDELRRPLYEKPFVVELFISPLVQAGREGHNVLSIPF